MAFPRDPEVIEYILTISETQAPTDWSTQNVWGELVEVLVLRA